LAWYYITEHLVAEQAQHDDWVNDERQSVEETVGERSAKRRGDVSRLLV